MEINGVESARERGGESKARNEMETYLGADRWGINCAA